MNNAVCAIIVAGGQGTRFKRARKLFSPIHGVCPLERVLHIFNHHQKINSIVLVLNEEWATDFPHHKWEKIIAVVSGGSTRQESVIKGFNALQSQAATPCQVLIHDAARPFVSPILIDAVVEALSHAQVVAPVLPLYDALKTIQNSQLKPFEPNEPVLRTQTPQGFLFSTLKDILSKASKDKLVFRDEIAMTHHYKPEIVIKAIPGEFTNEKITSNEQLPLLKKIMGEKHKTGIGYDFHYFESNKPLVLGGLTIPFDKGLEGHSDGDVLSHSILEGLLGALSLGDMGRFFGLNTPELKNIFSISLIKQLEAFCCSKGLVFTIHHIDATLVAQQPTLSSFVQSMQCELSKWLKIKPAQLNIKTTSDKGMDAAGSGKGIRSIALVDIIIYTEEENE